MTDPLANVTIGGDHVGNRTNADVDILQIYNSNTPFIIRELFEAFTNINEFDIESSNLQSLEIPEVVQLEYLTCFRNNITVLTANSFRNQRSLWLVEMPINNIQRIDEGVFATAPDLEVLILRYNNIGAIPHGTFTNNRWLLYVDFESNALIRLDAEIFMASPYLMFIFLEFNQIQAVSPHFVSTLPMFAEVVQMEGNVCVSHDFLVFNTDLRMIMNNALSQCFRNFNGITSERRSVTIEFTGSLTLTDEFGNIVGQF